MGKILAPRNDLVELLFVFNDHKLSFAVAEYELACIGLIRSVDAASVGPGWRNIVVALSETRERFPALASEKLTQQRWLQGAK